MILHLFHLLGGSCEVKVDVHGAILPAHCHDNGGFPQSWVERTVPCRRPHMKYGGTRRINIYF